MRYKNTHILSTLLIGALSQGVVINKALADDNTPAINILIEQASYWHERAQDDLAIESLNKVLIADTNNSEALYLMALWSIQRGEINAAKQWQERLEKAGSTPAKIQSLANAIKLKEIPQSQLNLARQQANSGNTNAALATWQEIFDGDIPPTSLAPEYYLTMAGDSSRYSEALSNLAHLHQKYPEDKSLTLAYAKAQTFQQQSRRQGINLLEQLASTNKEADDSLRQALLWLSPEAKDEMSYKQWITRHPEDNEVQTHYQNNVLGEIRTKGFEYLDANRLSSATGQFEKVLELDPNNTEALAGLGYIRYKEKNYVEANRYLTLAANQGGAQSASYQKQANEAAFYAQFNRAKQAYKTGNPNQAISLSSSLLNQPNNQKIAVQLFRADVFRNSKRYAEAESTLRRILKISPNNQSANESLYYVLRDQNKYDDAKVLYQSFSNSLKNKLDSTDDYRYIIAEANQALNNGNTQEAISILRKGMTKIPNNPWLRLDLARLLEKEGSSIESRNTIAPLQRPNSNNQSLYAAALFFSSQGEWEQTQQLLNRIPKRSRDKSINKLVFQADYNIEIAKVEDDIYYGRRISASSTLNKLSANLNLQGKPSNAGRVARLFAKNGEINTAIDVVKRSLSEGYEGDITNYIDHIIVLHQGRLYQESLNLLNNPKLFSNSTPEQIKKANNAYVIYEAQSLSDQQKYAAAYDHLIRALQQDPLDTDLMLAMAKLYQAGKMNDEAKVVYNYLLKNDTPNQEARVGAINVALAEGNVEEAKDLAEYLKDTQSPSRLVLLARLSEAEGNNQQAIANLRTARGKLVGLEINDFSTSPMIADLVLADNPFNSAYETAMPWQVNSTSQQSTINSANTTQRIDLPVESEQRRALTEVDTLLNKLNEESATWIEGGVRVRGRDGESGLSQLTEAKAPLKFSTIPLGDWRLNINLTPITLNAGTSSGDASRRFGTGALNQGQVAEANGISTLSGDSLGEVASQGAQTASGIETQIALSGYDFTFDIGTTPLGADLTTLVGGLSWSPKLSDYLRLTLKGERRAITDSLLSYVGVTDSYSGKTWGQVTKNGGALQLSYDDGDAGFYAGGGIWSYIGTNVSSNSSVDVGAGAYLRPINLNDRTFKTGINVNYMNFDKNISQYSFGQGGYFSPQNYISISFPQEYKQQFANLGLLIAMSVGYQAYSEDESTYFSNDADMQAELEAYVEVGQAEEAYYEASSTNGIGYNLRAGLDYKLSNKMTFGGDVYYDTFGDYNEYTAQLWLRHTFGGN